MRDCICYFDCHFFNANFNFWCTTESNIEYQFKSWVINKLSSSKHIVYAFQKIYNICNNSLVLIKSTTYFFFCIQNLRLFLSYKLSFSGITSPHLFDSPKYCVEDSRNSRAFIYVHLTLMLSKRKSKKLQVKNLLTENGKNCLFSNWIIVRGSTEKLKLFFTK